MKSNKKIFINKYLFTGVILILLGNNSCKDSKTTKKSNKSKEIISIKKNECEKVTPLIEYEKNLIDFIPKNYVGFEKIYGDLNKDGLHDCIVIVKGTDRNKIIKDKYSGKLDRNRRGIIILFSKNESYELAIKNLDCFSSENEEGGVYYPPELSAEVIKGNLQIHYSHGRYGYWQYTFRFQNSDFEFIGYDESSDIGPVIESETSINYVTKKKIVRENTNINAKGGDEIFKQTTTRIKVSKLTKLSKIKDFDELDVPE